MSSKHIFDDAVDDSDKSFVVGTGRRQKVYFGQVTLVTSAAAGNRQMALEVQDDSANLVFRSLAGAVQAASLTREYHFAPNPVREAAFVNGQIMVPIPPDLILLPGWTLRLYDTAAVAAAADDMTVSFLVDDNNIVLMDQSAG